MPIPESLQAFPIHAAYVRNGLVEDLKPNTELERDVRGREVVGKEVD